MSSGLAVGWAPEPQVRATTGKPAVVAQGVEIQVIELAIPIFADQFSGSGGVGGQGVPRRQGLRSF